MSNAKAQSTTGFKLKGQCHCGLVTFEFSPASVVDLNDPALPESVKQTIAPPSEQKHPERGGNVNKWKSTWCHCNPCRRTVGALAVEFVSVPMNLITIKRDGIASYRSSNHATRQFCPKCGTSLFFVEDDEKSIDVTLASITTPNLFDYIEMIGHIWLEDAKDLVLDEAGKGGGLAGIMTDGGYRTKQGSKSEPFY
ncbi:SubName: Full=Uncharacterized protein {ECO:0000313/EMBL:CCA77797.1} [Serendipita indica DSM 11827]|uniref:CENP-V/GFA domain-containing protein n=1 Tax=Serendipita indica (strain DSM 11827) TaxID=1109443 RepID=G4U2I5_SERID|nr:SubName: Full=Uncharacterized protein {ECO:0000313/EMBL:CCA77797.1} [Serendipita indica DSM 11827]CCA77797.1 hypothetical protein PIIN_03432 [Serendipita indica DSM 11827]